ncbi:hypothetical protein YC2023_020142 [Brassica napus]
MQQKLNVGGGKAWSPQRWCKAWSPQRWFKVVWWQSQLWWCGGENMTFRVDGEEDNFFRFRVFRFGLEMQTDFHL